MARPRNRPLTPAERGRLGGLATASRHDPTERGRAGQAGLQARLRADITRESLERGEEISEVELERRLGARRAELMLRANLKRWGKAGGSRRG